MSAQLELVGSPVSTARFSSCMQYRYELTRRWGDGAEVCWVMLNPSTADAAKDDPTIRRCVGFAKRWGYGALTVVNLFAWRSTQRAVLKTLADPVGTDNDRSILEAVGRSESTVIAWGTDGVVRGRSAAVLRMLGLRPVGYFRLTKNGQPEHPLYQPNEIALQVARAHELVQP